MQRLGPKEDVLPWLVFLSLTVLTVFVSVNKSSPSGPGQERREESGEESTQH